MNVLLADDHAQVRWALRTFLEEQLSLTVVGEVADSEALLLQVPLLQPDLILLDWELPGRPAEEVLDALRSQGDSCKIVVVSQRPECQWTALQAGADAFLSKTAQPGQVLRALRELGAGMVRGS